MQRSAKILQDIYEKKFDFKHFSVDKQEPLEKVMREKT